MIEQELTYQDLRILSSEIYEAMGYKDSIPDQMVIDETNTLLKRVIPLLRPRFAFFFMEGTLDIEKETLSVQSIHPPTVNPIQDTIPTRSPEQNTFSTQSKSTVFSVGKTIARQLRGSEAFVFLQLLPELSLRYSSIRCNKKKIWSNIHSRLVREYYCRKDG